MPDMLVKLYELPDDAPLRAELEDAGFTIRRALVPEKHLIRSWVKEKFNPHWESECDVAISGHPTSCFIATLEDKLVGFACYDATCKGFFGPTGVDDVCRGKGVGTALLLACLHDMRAQGYGYAVIGGAGPVAFYEKTVGAIEIPDSKPGIYKGMLRS